MNGKKYGLVFEEHQETIDTVLAEHTPVLTEETDLLIDNGGEMNFLLEGDNLAALRLLEKTHRGRIDLIYIDPPYNTGNKDFVYDDTFVDKTDTFIHSKWLSFISERLMLTQSLLSPQGVIVISIGYQEVHNLVMLCQEIFSNRQVVCVTVQTSGGKPNGGFTYTQEYLVFIVPEEFAPSAMSFTGGIERSPFEGLTLSTFDKTTRPNQTYPIFIDKKTMHIVGVGKSLTERVNDGTYTGELKDFSLLFENSSVNITLSFVDNRSAKETLDDLVILDLWSKGNMLVFSKRLATDIVPVLQVPPVDDESMIEVLSNFVSKNTQIHTRIMSLEKYLQQDFLLPKDFSIADRNAIPKVLSIFEPVETEGTLDLSVAPDLSLYETFKAPSSGQLEVTEMGEETVCLFGDSYIIRERKFSILSPVIENADMVGKAILSGEKPTAKIISSTGKVIMRCKL